MPDSQQEPAPLKIGLLGCGTVGSQVARLLTTQQKALQERVGRRLELVDIAVRELRERPGLDPELFTTDAMSLAAREDLDILIELIGGIEPCEELVLTALKNKK